MRKSRGPEYWEHIPADHLLMRVQNRAHRLARLIEAGAPPMVIANEKLILDEVYDEWARRTGAEPTLEEDE